jgi:hypothetical protein
MSRSGYVDDLPDNDLALYRGRVANAIKGKRGQSFLRELAALMDAMPLKELIEGELVNSNGECCALGVVCKARNLDADSVDYEDPEAVGALVGISSVMAAEIEYENDEGITYRVETPSQRWIRMRAWIAKQIK